MVSRRDEGRPALIGPQSKSLEMPLSQWAGMHGNGQPHQRGADPVAPGRGSGRSAPQLTPAGPAARRPWGYLRAAKDYPKPAVGFWRSGGGKARQAATIAAPAIASPSPSAG